MIAIWKYPLALHFGHQVVEVPDGGCEVLHVAMQDLQLTAWVEVWDTEVPLKKLMHIYIAGTGHAIPEEVLEDYAYVDTVQFCGLVYHIYVEDSCA